jgi:DNA polymerase III epsilon subunit-like protein
MKITAEDLVLAWRKRLQESMEESILDDLETSEEGKVHVRDVLEKIKKEAEKATWIFFDTETTGFMPEWEQLTEVAAIAVELDMDTNNSKIIGEFNKLCHLTDKTKRKIEKDKTVVKLGIYDPKYPKVTGQVRGKRGYLEPKRMSTGHILDMTNYFKNVHNKTAEVVSEKESLEELDKFIKSFPNPILVIHNESFDRKFIDGRAKATGANVDTTSYRSTDTLQISRAVFCPVVTLSDELAHVKLELSKGSKLNKVTGKQEEVINKKLSSRLGLLAKALAVDATRWHTAIADVEMLLKVFDKMVSILKKNADMEITADYNEVMSKSMSYAKEAKAKADSLAQQAAASESEPAAPAPQNEGKLSKYWKDRAVRKAKRAKREEGNKQDKDWAKGQQDLSTKLNKKIFKLFEKELASTNETSDEVTSFLKKMKKEKRRKKLKMLEKKKANAIPPLESPKKLSKKKAKNPYAGEKKPGKKYPYEGSRNGFQKTLNKRIKKAGGYALPMGAAYGGGSAAMEESQKIAQPKKVVKSRKKDENK